MNTPLYAIRPRSLAWLFLCFVLSSWLCAAPSALAQNPVRIIQREQRFVFSQSLDFTLAIQSASPVVEVILFYGRDGVPLVRRIYPQFTPATQLTISHSEELESGQYAPGTLMRVWWELRLQDGLLFKTPVETFEYTDDRQNWQRLTGDRALLHYYGKNESTAQGFLARAEEAIHLLQDQIGIVVEKPVRIYVYNDARDMQAALSTRSEGYDSRVVTLGVAVSEDTLLLLGDHRDAQQTLAHELSHIVVGMATDNPYADLPRWLDEGLAMYAEGKLPLDNQRALERAIRNDALLSVRSMSSYTSQASEVDLFYGEVFSLVDFMLREYGREKMTALLEVFSQGARQEDALQQVYGFGLDELDRLWRQSLGLKPRPTVAPSSSLLGAPTPKSNLWGAFTAAAQRVLAPWRLWRSLPSRTP